MQKLVWHTEKRKVKELTPTESNPRQMTEKQAKDLQSSLERFNLVDIPAINTDNRIISGHQRVNILKALKRGNETIDVRVPNRKLTEEEHREYLLRANKNTGEWDFDLLANFDESLLKDIGFESIELDRIFQLDDKPEDDDAPETPKKAISKRGDIYLLGKHRIMCGDATDKKDMDKLMDGVKADMVFTDPPYGVSYGDKNKFLNAVGRGNSIQENIKNDTLSEKNIMVFWKKAFEIIRDNLAPINSYYIFGPQIQGMMMMMMMMEAGLPYRHVIIWVKNNHVLGRCDYNYRHEPIFFGWTTKHKFYKGGQFKTSVWEVNKPHSSRLHPTMKPVELIENAIMNSSKRGQIVLDPFLGSGSTAIACEKTERICYGVEISPEYIDVCISRWCKFTGKTEVIRNGEKMTWKL